MGNHLARSWSVQHKKTRKSMQRLQNIENPLGVISQPKKFTICLQLIAYRRARRIFRHNRLSRKEQKPNGLWPKSIVGFVWATMYKWKGTTIEGSIFELEICYLQLVSNKISFRSSISVSFLLNFICVQKNWIFN